MSAAAILRGCEVNFFFRLAGSTTIVSWALDADARFRTRRAAVDRRVVDIGGLVINVRGVYNPLTSTSTN